jgi:hypothetical protein
MATGKNSGVDRKEGLGVSQSTQEPAHFMADVYFLSELIHGNCQSRIKQPWAIAPH